MRAPQVGALGAPSAEAPALESGWCGAHTASSPDNKKIAFNKILSVLYHIIGAFGWEKECNFDSTS